MNKLRVFEAFAGYGSQELALQRLSIDYEVVGISEIDADAIIAYAAIRHGNAIEAVVDDSNTDDLERMNVAYDFKKNKSKLQRMSKKKKQLLINANRLSKNFGDISLIDPKKLPDFDLFTFSFPCQDISISGKKAGLESGTRSGLLYECEKIIEEKRPKFLLMENVKNLVGKQFKPDFDAWLAYLESIGYKNYWQIVNAKDYTIPQNRERVFVISILSDHEPYSFPEPIELDKRIRDILEENVDEKFYINRPFKLVNKINQAAELEMNGHDVLKRIQDVSMIAPTVSTICGGYQEPKILVAGDTGSTYKSQAQILDSSGIATTLKARDFKDPIRIVEERFFRQALETLDEKECSVGDTINAFNKSVNSSGLCPTITTRPDGFKTAILPVVEENYIGIGHHPLSKKKEFSGWKDSDCPCLIATDYKAPKTVAYEHEKQNLRVRKLTPLECWRLMDVSDEHYYAVEKYISNSQLYKLAGNSIVVSVLEYLFKNLLEVTE